MAAEYVISVINQAGKDEMLSLSAFHSEKRDVLEATVSGEVRRYEAGNLFIALLDLRRDLEREGKRLLCAGARIDVWPSRMSTSMGGGKMAYRTRLGQQAKMEDLVDIFSPAAIDEVVSVQEQVAFHDKWAAHFRDLLTAKGS